MYSIYRVSVDSAEERDPDEWADEAPTGGARLPARFATFMAACIEADATMQREQNPTVAYFVVPGGYSTGLVDDA
jgi:hypothetical protein